MKRKIFILFLVLAASAGTMYAEVTHTIDGICYILDTYNKTASVTRLPNIGNFWQYYSGDVVIPGQISYNSKNYAVTSIGDNAFNETDNSNPPLTSVTIPNSVTKIGNSAFYKCRGLTSITIPNSVTSIGDLAFCYCSSLSSVTIPNSVTSIGACAFEGCSFTSLIIPNSVTSIGSSAFDYCVNLTSIEIPNSITSIEFGVFSDCTSLTSITIPNSVTSIGGWAFYRCSSLPSITIPNSVTSIGEAAFWFCSSLTSIDIPNGVTSIESSTFSDCSNLTSVIIPNSVTEIEHAAFENCTNLTSITIPSSVTGITGGAFKNCVNLTSVTCAAMAPPERLLALLTNNPNQHIFSGVDCSQIPLYVPRKSISAYQTADTWREFDPIMAFDSILETYTITFLNYDSTELLVLTEVEEGEMPVYTGETPTRPADSQYTYTFSGWNPEIAEATEDATYTATFSSTLNKYTISANASHGKVIGTGEYAYGTEVELTAIPDNGYEFHQWSDGVTDNPRTIIVTGDAEYTALFVQGQGVDEIYVSGPVRTVIIDDKIFILRDDKTYTIQGQEVK